MNQRVSGGRFARTIAAGLLVSMVQAAPAAPAFEDRYVEVNGIRLHYVSAGKGR